MESYAPSYNPRHQSTKQGEATTHYHKAHPKSRSLTRLPSLDITDQASQRFNGRQLPPSVAVFLEHKMETSGKGSKVQKDFVFNIGQNASKETLRRMVSLLAHDCRDRVWGMMVDYGTGAKVDKETVDANKGYDDSRRFDTRRDGGTSRQNDGRGDIPSPRGNSGRATRHRDSTYDELGGDFGDISLQKRYYY
ncbi:uncharacterized protein KY384_004546 [Bacidia gigantensis]|uniref:uncharacterized protein n=1 Tax=Bacidia gigantensis TaxID=2732470 RepID=UPI001D055D63|nr:uncharacterized protein KY384_004546 [Bacidia gigantensis]KAG8531188.1 hypothetical protein KY384_004546 [Bacidia gigantensis]